MEVLPGRRQNELQNADPMQLDDIGSLGLFSSNSILLVGNIMPITSHLVAKNSIVAFGVLTDFKIRVSHYKKDMFKSTSNRFFFHPLVLVSKFQTVGSADPSFSTGSPVG